MAWKFNDFEPVFVQITKKLREDILRGEFLPDEQFPSVRQLAFEAAVNPNTMQKALSCLEDEGLLCTKGTVGRFVTSDEAFLSSAREKMRRETVKAFVSDMKRAGITKEELIRYIEEEEGKI